MSKFINFFNRTLKSLLFVAQQLKKRYKQVKLKYKYYNGAYTGWFEVTLKNI